MYAAVGLFRLTRSITFAAPDVARNDFSLLLDELDAFYERQGTALLTKPTLTLYCSRRDLALVVSSGVRSLGHDKSGRAGFFWRKRTKLTHLLKGGWWGHHVHPLLDKRILTVDTTGFSEDMMGHGYFRSNRQVLEDISNAMAGRERYTIVPGDEHSACPKTCRPLVEAADSCKPLHRLKPFHLTHVQLVRLVPRQVLYGDSGAGDDSDGHSSGTGSSSGHQSYLVGNSAVEVVVARFDPSDDAARTEAEAAARQVQEREHDGQQLVVCWRGTYTGAGRYRQHFG